MPLPTYRDRGVEDGAERDGAKPTVEDKIELQAEAYGGAAGIGGTDPEGTHGPYAEDTTELMVLNISDHITYSEATVTGTGLANDPGPAELFAMQSLAQVVFEPLRRWVGGPIKINSFYRSPAVNAKVGGSRTSQHVKGEAMDIDMDLVSGAKKTNAEVFAYIRDYLPYDQIIWEFGTSSNPAWVHVSYSAKGRNRKMVLRAKRTAKGTTYERM